MDFYKQRRPIGHDDDDEWAPYWRYSPGCGCVLCLAWEQDMLDGLEQDWWEGTAYADDEWAGKDDD